MEIATEELTPLRWAQEIDHLIEFLQDKSKHELIVSYGWGCDLDMDNLYQEVSLPLSGLREWIMQATTSGIFILGEGTLHLRSQDKEIEFELCHEADIHLTTDNPEMAQEVAADWAGRGLTSYKVGQAQSSAGQVRRHK